MSKFESVSILLPTLNETFSFRQTVEIIIAECEKNDICELIAIVCERTLPESLQVIQETKDYCASLGYKLDVLYQHTPYAGGAVRDGMDYASGSHTIMMAPDLETDPHTVKDLIESAKQYPNDVTTASRWLKKGNFEGYNKLKYCLNFLFQKVFTFIYGVRLTDITFGYRIAPSALFQAIRWEEEKHPFFLETALKPIRLGVVFHEIPSMWAARQEGESQNSLIQTFKYLRIAFKVRFENKKHMIKEDADITEFINKT